jgi:hypothetical protein
MQFQQLKGSISLPKIDIHESNRPEQGPAAKLKGLHNFHHPVDHPLPIVLADLMSFQKHAQTFILALQMEE